MVLDSPQWGGFHPFVAEFEQSFAAYQHARYGIGADEWQRHARTRAEGPGHWIRRRSDRAGDLVHYDRHRRSRTGAMPVFVDIEADSYNIDPGRVREAITPKTKAVIPVHFGGAMCDIRALLEICRERDLVLLEDAAHAHGAEYDGKRAWQFRPCRFLQFSERQSAHRGRRRYARHFRRALRRARASIANCGRVPGRGFSEHHESGTIFASRPCMPRSCWRNSKGYRRRSGKGKTTCRIFSDLTPILKK